MRKLIFASLLMSFAGVSCKKERSCTCTTTTVSSTVNGSPLAGSNVSQTTTTKYERARKNSIVCNSSEDVYDESVPIFGVNYTYHTVTKTECTLE